MAGKRAADGEPGLICRYGQRRHVPVVILAFVALWVLAAASTAVGRTATLRDGTNIASTHFGFAAEGAAPMGGVTEGGATISHSATATAIGDDANTLQNLARSQGAGGHDVIVHGADGNFMVNGVATHPQQIADAVLANPAYTGGPINLVTCGGACGPAQELEEILGASVRARPGNVDLDPTTGFLRDLPW